MDRASAYYELALPHYREAVRIYQANNLVEDADDAARNAKEAETWLQYVSVLRAAPSRG